MAKCVCCGLNFEATILKKRDQIYNESAKFELPEKMLFYGLCSSNALIDRDIRWIVTADMFSLNLTIKHHNIEIYV